MTVIERINERPFGETTACRSPEGAGMSLEDQIAEAVRVVVREEVRDAFAQHGNESEGWMTTESLAVYLDSSPEAVRDLIRRGLLPIGRKLPGSSRWLFKRGDVDKLLAVGKRS